MKVQFCFKVFLLLSLVVVNAKLGGKKRRKDLRQRTLQNIQSFGPDPTGKYPLNRCQGDCDKNRNCKSGLVCWQRKGNQDVPGCQGGSRDNSRTDYCVDPDDIPGPAPPGPTPTRAPVVAPTPTQPAPTPNSPTGGSNPKIKNYGGDPPSSRLPLGECEGDCDDDGDCRSGLYCFQRKSSDSIPGCSGTDSTPSDYCVRRGGTPPSPSPPTPSPIRSPVAPTPAGLENFRLKLYWQRGYDWQEESIEREWCMQCRNSGCNRGNKIYISKCGNKNQRFDFVTVNGNGEVLIKLHGKDLCFQRDKRDIFIRTCNAGESKQLWFAKVGGFGERRFEISPRGESNWCITQRHHPKADEEVEIESCATARKGETSFWNRF